MQPRTPRERGRHKLRWAVEIGSQVFACRSCLPPDGEFTGGVVDLAIVGVGRGDR